MRSIDFQSKDLVEQAGIALNIYIPLTVLGWVKLL
jgi:hypothetical protein